MELAPTPWEYKTNASVKKRVAENVVFAEVAPKVVDTWEMVFIILKYDAEICIGTMTGAIHIELVPGSMVAEW